VKRVLLLLWLGINVLCATLGAAVLGRELYGLLIEVRWLPNWATLAALVAAMFIVMLLSIVMPFHPGYTLEFPDRKRVPERRRVADCCDSG
jgi:hypothetical protein